MAVAARACLAATLVAATVTMGAAPAAADTFFRAETTVTAVHLTVTQKPASSIIIRSLIDDAVAYAASDFESGAISAAQAAPVFPGLLVVQGPQLLCSQLFPCPAQPPDYPLLADASYPRQGKDSADVSGEPMGSGPVFVTPLAAHAEADANSNASRTTAGEAALLAGTPAAVTIGGNRARSTVQSGDDGVRVHAVTVVTDVTVGGQLHIDAIRAESQIELRAGGVVRNRPTMRVSGVTFAGQQASIDDSGVHVAGMTGPSPDQQLSQQGIEVHTVGVDRDSDANSARSSATGLSIDVELPVKGVPYIPNPLPPFPPPFDQIPTLPGINANGTYVAQLTLGTVGAVAGAGREPTFDLGVPAPPAPPAGHRNVPPTPGTVAAPPPGGNDLVTQLSTPDTEAPPAVSAPPQSMSGGITDLLSKTQLEILYAVLALGTVALFVGWRGSVLLSRWPLAAGRRRQ